MDKPGYLASQLSSAEIETALSTLAEIVDEGHQADLSSRQQEVGDKVYRLWAEKDESQ